LTDKINEGGSLFFDCPPIDYNQKTKDNKIQNYWSVVNKANRLEKAEANSPRVIVDIRTHYGKDGKAH
jgi:hypothetical protein